MMHFKSSFDNDLWIWMIIMAIVILLFVFI